MSEFWALNVPLHCWLIRLAEGWQLPWIVEPMKAHHGAWAVLMTREDEPLEQEVLQ